MRRAMVAAIMVGFAATKASAVDVPTWQVGDWWEAKRGSNIRFGTTTPVNLAFNLATTETYRLTVVEIADLKTTGGQPVKVYRRTRSSGSVSGKGSFTSGSLTINFRWKPGSATSGEDWTAVSDLAISHERFLLAGELQTQLLFFWVNLATVTIDSATDAIPPREAADFPIATVGEQWQTPFRQHSYGRLKVKWNPLFAGWGGAAPPDMDQPYDTSSPATLSYRYTGLEPRGDFPKTYHIEVLPVGSLWYEPTIKEYVESSLGTGNLGGSMGLENMTTIITSHSLAADAAIQNLTFTPAKPYRAKPVTLSGTTNPGTTVTATILGEGPSVRRRADSSGRFSLSLVAPNHDDNSPSNDDGGSFGVEVVALGVGRKVVTLQLSLPPTAARRGWSLYR
jgi:hypothetical protein